MKELSIEEKAKAYDKVIEIAKSWYADAQIDFKKSLETLFPELKESEDERIRKFLITFFINDYGKNSNARFAGIKVKDIISWLEKQAQKTNPCDGCINRKGCINCENGELRETEQEPAELGENRSKELSLSLQIQAYLNTASDELYAKGKPLYSKERIEDIHKCMQMWQKLHNAYFYHNLVEWSEEDETRLTNVIIMLKEGASLHFNKKDITKAVDFLGTLKDRYTWKPSDEQIGVIEAVINNRSFQRRHLDSLYEQLKNLKEGKL